MLKTSVLRSADSLRNCLIYHCLPESHIHTQISYIQSGLLQFLTEEREVYELKAFVFFGSIGLPFVVFVLHYSRQSPDFQVLRQVTAQRFIYLLCVFAFTEE